MTLDLFLNLVTKEFTNDMRYSEQWFSELQKIEKFIVNWAGVLN